MGWFTNRTKSWELKNMWGVFLTFLFIFLFLTGVQSAFIAAMGIIVKKRSWIIMSFIIYFLGMVGSFAGLFFSLEDDYVFIWMTCAVLNCIYAAFITKEYLQRLDLQKSGVALEWGKKYEYEKEEGFEKPAFKKSDFR